MTNFAGTLAVDAAGVALAAFGYLNPVLAALIHVSSELVFILNSARLLSGASSRALYSNQQQTAPVRAAKQTAA
jgi:Cd2+/Zn2+-exporting ATPase/Cu+-exporting ATPase